MRRNGFHPLDVMLPRRFELLLLVDDLRDFENLEVVPVGEGVPDDTPDELLPEIVDMDPFDDVVRGCEILIDYQNYKFNFFFLRQHTFK